MHTGGGAYLKYHCSMMKMIMTGITATRVIGCTTPMTTAAEKIHALEAMVALS